MLAYAITLNSVAALRISYILSTRDLSSKKQDGFPCQDSCQISSYFEGLAYELIKEWDNDPKKSKIIVIGKFAV